MIFTVTGPVLAFSLLNSLHSSNETAATVILVVPLSQC